MRRSRSAKELAALPSKPGRHACGFGLYQQISRWNTRSWIFRCVRRGRAYHLGLGSCLFVTLPEARDKAFQLQRRLANGESIESIVKDRRIRGADNPATVSTSTVKDIETFERAAMNFIEAHEDGWRGHASRKQWYGSLRKHVFPAIGAKSVDAITTKDVLDVIDPLVAAAPETGKRVLGRIKLILDWAHRTTDGYQNPAAKRGLLPKNGKHVEHFKMLPVDELPKFMSELRQADDIAARALELQILIAGRPQDVLHARWREIDLQQCLWTVSGQRVKSGQDHVIPLSDRTVALLEALPREGDDGFVFIGNQRGKGLSTGRLQALLERMGRKGLSSHAIARAGFSTWARERTSADHNVIELSLAHRIGDAVMRAYARSDLMAKRRALMQEWASFLWSAS